MMELAYLIETVETFDKEVVAEMLTTRGRQGWELVNVSPTLCVYFFKRRTGAQATGG